MSSVRCDGHEMRLENCSHSNGVGMTNCHHERDAGVLCEGNVFLFFFLMLLVINFCDS